MKKFLLTTTAIVGLAAFGATGAQAADIDLNIGGQFKAYAGTTDQDTADLRETDLKREAEIHVNGETTLDNGLTVGVNFEFQAEPDDAAGAASAASQTPNEASDVEESYIYFSGNWGRVNVGAEDGAAYLLQVAAPGADSNIDGLDPDFLFVNAPTGFNASTRYATDPSGDADKVTYLTPKFNGFQAGITYSPDVTQEVTGENLGGAESDITAGDLEDHYEIAVRYDGEYEGVSVHAGAGWATASTEVDAGTATAVGSDDLDEWNVGVKLGFDQFGIGVAYHETNNAVQTNGDTDTFIIGADYTHGAYRVGASYLTSEGEALATTGDDELDRYSIGAGYTYGPGMSFRGSVNFYEFDDAVATASNDATSILVGTDISF